MMNATAIRRGSSKLPQICRSSRFPSQHHQTIASISKQCITHASTPKFLAPLCGQVARLTTSAVKQHAAPKTKDRGPKSEEDTQTDFGAMDVLSNTPVPTTAIDSCIDDGFALNSGLKVTGSGVLLVGGEAFKWRPWIRKGRIEEEGMKAGHSTEGGLSNARGQWDVDAEAWGVLDLVWPKPDLLILGTGRSVMPISPKTRSDINALGIRIEVQDTRNAAAQFNLLATERGVQQVAAALVPIGWKGGR